MEKKKWFLISLSEDGNDVKTKQREKPLALDYTVSQVLFFSSLILMIKWMWNNAYTDLEQLLKIF